MPDKNHIGFSFIILQSVDSTNNYATALAHAGMAQHGTVVFAHHQTNGKGQRHKQWLAEGGLNITLSIIIVPSKEAHPNFVFSMAMALGAFHFFNKHAVGDVCIKWPNDIYWNDRKAGGILIENIFSGTLCKYNIVGIGLNINQVNFAGLDTKAVSLKQITGKSYNVETLAKDLCQSINTYYLLYLKNPEQIISEYHQHLYKLNQAVKLKKQNRVFSAVIKGVNNSGQLITQHALEETFNVGEIEWIIEN